MDTASVGLVRRVENMVGDTPHYREELNRRHEHALTRIAELEAVADEPFEHTDTLRDKRHRTARKPKRKRPNTSSGWTPRAANRVEFGAEPDTSSARGVRGRGAGPPWGTRRRWLGYPGVGGRRGGCGTRRPGGGAGVIGCAAGGRIGLSRAGQSEHRAGRVGGGCAGTTSHPSAARGPAPRRGPRPVSRGRRIGYSTVGAAGSAGEWLFSPRAGVCSGRGWRVRGAFGGRSPASLSCFAVHPPASALAWAVRAVSAAWCSASRAWVAAASCLRCTSRASPRVFTRAMRSASSVLAAAAAAALPDRGGGGSLMPPVCRTPRLPHASGGTPL